MPKFVSQEEEWRAYLAGTHPSIKFGQRTFRHIPSSPRCKLCSAPFAGMGRLLFGRLGFTPWDKNPNLCLRCLTTLDRQEVSGAEIEVSFLFADVRRSSDLARRLGTMEFTKLMQRFYAVATDVLIADDGIIEKFVGDEVVGFFMPLMAGPNHAAAAVRAAEHLMLETGHGEESGPWLPLGAGVHTGIAFVGMVSRGMSSDFTAFGDPINVAAHVAAQAGPGEILITDAAAAAAGLGTGGLERRHLSLKGHEADAVVLAVPSVSSGSVSPP
jgi:adenylate cyclase